MILRPATRLEVAVAMVCASGLAIAVSVKVSESRAEAVLDRIEKVCDRLESNMMAGGIRQEQHIHQRDDWWAAAVKDQLEKNDAKAIR